ncbi:hypothetical protein WICPIJ_004521 [Wickerhamomyces pijperi]|uniref:Uncharacterized protein n=1 Tax=Wickerhamomyces pijperi TaxID=599730 RepID=A0A9P8Q579_WICPI|nr:hypothetical protein WICPIJ_004521 [Wickerhamomyces pijperi]
MDIVPPTYFKHLSPVALISLVSSTARWSIHKIMFWSALLKSGPTANGESSLSLITASEQVASNPTPRICEGSTPASLTEDLTQ